MARGMISIESRGSFKNIRGFFKRTKRKNFREILEVYGEKGVYALAMETPVDTGVTATSWTYEIEQQRDQITLYWKNSALADDGQTPIVILIQYGHGTGNGGYVMPYDFINPVTKEIFEEIADSIWKEVTA